MNTIFIYLMAPSGQVFGNAQKWLYFNGDRDQNLRDLTFKHVFCTDPHYNVRLDPRAPSQWQHLMAASLRWRAKHLAAKPLRFVDDSRTPPFRPAPASPKARTYKTSPAIAPPAQCCPSPVCASFGRNLLGPSSGLRSGAVSPGTSTTSSGIGRFEPARTLSCLRPKVTNSTAHDQTHM